MPLLDFIPAIAGLVASVVGALWALYRRNLYSKREIERLATQRRLFEELESVRAPLQAEGGRTEESFDDLKREILKQVSAIRTLDEKQVKERVEQKLKRVEHRLEMIEERFPDAKMLDKVATLNEALLAERLDQLVKRVDGLEDRQLSRWDVALVVSTIIGGIFAVVAATYGVLRLLEGG